MGGRQVNRLVTQFDEQRSRATAATPTCGGCCCCCCCCCVASVLTSTAVTVLNVSDAAVERNVRQPMRAMYLLAGFAVLPTAAVVGIGVGDAVSGRGALAAGVAVGIVIWSGLLASIYGWLGLGVGRSARVIAITVISGPVLFVGELVGGVWLLLGHTDEFGTPSGEGPGIYMVLVFLLPFLLVPLLRAAMGMRRGRSLRAIVFGRGPGDEHWPPRT